MQKTTGGNFCRYQLSSKQSKTLVFSQVTWPHGSFELLRGPSRPDQNPWGRGEGVLMGILGGGGGAAWFSKS